MNCKYCGKPGVPEKALFCPWCGEKQIRSRKKKPEPKSPKPRTLTDGSLLGQLMVDGRRETIKAKDEAEYKARIDAIRTGVLELKAHPDRRPLKQVLRAYIDKNDAVLSPATIRGYETIYDNRFKSYMDKPINAIDFQRMVNAEAKSCAPKTTKNAWALVSAALKDAKLPVPDVNLPAIPDSDGDFLDYEQIQAFLKAIRGDDCELAALLLLHGLRISEALKLTAGDVNGNVIRVRGAVVPDKTHRFVEKTTNKNRASSRDVPIMIPRLSELLPKEGKLILNHPSTIRTHVEKACKKAKVPVCSAHDLRRSMASLAKHLGWMPDTLMRIGGWSDMTTVNKIYAKLADKDADADIAKMQNYYQITTDSKSPVNKPSIEQK